jgi:hypothetical protein
MRNQKYIIGQNTVLLQFDEINILFWSFLLVPDKAPYNKVIIRVIII